MRPIRTLSLVLLLCTAATAQSAGASGPGARRVAAQAPAPVTGTTVKEVRDTFSKADADRSGGLTADEAVFGGLDAAAFAAADADASNRLSLDEFVVASETRAKAGAGAAPDLTAESTRIQALRRAQKSEARRTARAEPAIGAGTTAAAPQGPAAARRALPPAPAAGEVAPPTVEELRASILRRLRRGDISPDEARVALEAVDRRIANSKAATAGENATASAGASTSSTAGATSTSAGAPASSGGSAKQPLDLQAIEESLARRVRNSGLEADAAAQAHQDVQRRIDNSQKAGAGEPAAAGTAAPAPQGFRERLTEAQSDLSRRLRHSGASPDQVEAEQAALARRIRKAAGSLAPEPSAAGATADGSATAETSGAASASGRSRADAPPPTSNPPARRPSDAAPSAPPAPAPAPAPARPEGAKPDTRPQPPADGNGGKPPAERPPAAKPPEKEPEAPKPAPARPAKPAPKPDGGGR